MCFLCDPSSRLVVQKFSCTYAMVGLGPLSPLYCIFATLAHSRSMSQAIQSCPQVALEFEIFRQRLEHLHGPVIISEHGNVPVCRDGGDQHEQHCFHAHFLVFGSTIDIRDRLSTYFRLADHFCNLTEALRNVRSNETYVLLSPSANEFSLYREPLNVPRQLVRMLVAHSLDEMHLADWRDAPNRELAEKRATELRRTFGGKVDAT